jgi:hypothetical protein
MSRTVALMLALAVVAAGVLAAGSSGARQVQRIGVLPQPASALGSEAESLPLEPGSGVEGPVGALLTPTRSVGVLLKDLWAKLGHTGGYALDYGLGASGGAGVTEVWTSVDEYRTRAGANKGLAFWKAVDPGDIRYYIRYAWRELTIALKAKKVAAVGGRRFAFLVSYSAVNIAPVFGLDEQFTEGRYEARVTVWAGSAAAAATLAPTLAKKLDARIKRALEGKLHAKPVKLPATPKPGPLPGGPDLIPLALQASDLNGPTTAYGPRYSVDWLNPTALSDLHVDMNPAGQFEAIGQDIEWSPTANQAGFTADFWLAQLLAHSGTKRLDLGSVGDGARGIVANDSHGGEARVVFSSGRLVEILEVGDRHGVQPPEVQTVAQTVANHIDAAGLGSRP